MFNINIIKIEKFNLFTLRIRNNNIVILKFVTKYPIFNIALWRIVINETYI